MRPWQVLLVGGAAGTGKTRLAYQLACHFQVGITAVDDFQIILERLTTPEQQPALHYWRTHPEAADLPAEQILELHLAAARTMAPGIEAVIADHIEFDTPLVLEGDYLLPLSTTHSGLVRAVFLYEPDEAQIVRNFAEREPEAGEQTKRARVSWLLGQWLQEEAGKYGIAALPARPWETLLERTLAALCHDSPTQRTG